MHFDPTISSNKPAFDKILGYIEKAKAAGGQILIGGIGRYFAPTYMGYYIDFLLR